MRTKDIYLLVYLFVMSLVFYCSPPYFFGIVLILSICEGIPIIFYLFASMIEANLAMAKLMAEQQKK